MLTLALALVHIAAMKYGQNRPSDDIFAASIGGDVIISIFVVVMIATSFG